MSDFIVPDTVVQYINNDSLPNSGFISTFTTYFSGQLWWFNWIYNEKELVIGNPITEYWLGTIVDSGQITALSGNQLPYFNLTGESWYKFGLNHADSGVNSIVYGTGFPLPLDLIPENLIPESPL